MKKGYLILLVFIVLAAPAHAFAANSISAPADHVLVSIQEVNGSPMGTIIVPVELDSQGNGFPAALNLDISFDNAVMDLQDVTISDSALSAGKELVYVLVSDNIARIVVYGLEQNTMMDGSLFDLEFASTSSENGTYPLSISSLTLADPQAVELRGTGVDGAVIISSETQIFTDVPPDHWAYKYIEALYQGGYSAGCSSEPLKYCPDQDLARAHMAVFVERSHHGASFIPTDPASPVFEDVTVSHWAYDWTAEMYEDGYTAGCSADPLKFCPDSSHTRAEAAVFLLRIKHGWNYEPDPATGIFSDVPAENYWAARWIEAAYEESLLPACETIPDLKFCPDIIVDRALAAYGVSIAKGLLPPPSE